MKTRNFVLSALGLAAAITFGGAESASAQRAKSQTRIPVRKEPVAEPVAVKPDTVYITRHDTVTIRGRTDTMTIRQRPDTVVQMVYPPLGTMQSFQFGVGAGVAVPMNDWRNSTKDGPAAHAHLGFYPGNGMFGLRFDGDAAFLHHRDTDCKTCADPRVYSGSADLVLRFPLDRQGNLNPVMYILGGGGLDKFTNFLAYQAGNGETVTAGSDTYAPYTAGPPWPFTGPAVAISTTNRGTKSLFYHYDLGTGLEFGRGSTRFFVEAKYLTINTQALKGAGAAGGGTISGSHNSHYWPIIAGLSFGH